MMGIIKNRFPIILIVCILAIILIVALYFVFFFNRTTIFCSSRTKLAGLLRTDFTDVEITDIQCISSKDGILDDYTEIIVFLKESNEWESKKFYTYSEESSFYSNLENMPSTEIERLKTIGIEKDSIQKRGVNFNQIRVGFSIGEFGIYWCQIDESYDGESNIVLIAGIPRKISMNVDKIIKAK